MPKELTPRLPGARVSLPMPISAPQASITSNSPRSTSTSNLLMPHTSIDPPTSTQNYGEDMTLWATAVGVHQLSSQVAIAPEVVQDPLMVSPGILNVVEPSQLAINTSQLTVGASQSVAGPSQAVTEPSQAVFGPSQIFVKPSQPDPESSNVSAGAVPVGTQPDSTAIPTPSQPPTEVVNAALDIPVPKVPYRVRNSAPRSSGRPRQGSIDGAPEMVIDVTDNEQEMVVEVIDVDDEQETTVDLRDHINMELDDNKSQISSSQKSADECRELTLPPPDSQQRGSIAGGTEGSMGRSEFASSRTRPQLDVDEEDLPVWMAKKGQWKYVASTAGGTAWENLLKIYMDQERRLEFTEMVSELFTSSLLLALNHL